MGPEVAAAALQALSVVLVGAGVLLLAFQARTDRKLAAERAERFPV